MRVSSISNKFIVENGKRFEGKYYLNDNSFLSMQIECLQGETCRLSTIADVFNPPVFKRQFCKATERSVPYFQSSNVPVVSEFSDVYVFKKQASSLNLLVKKGDILITGFGTIGNIRVVSKYQDGVCYANNVCRVRLNDDENTGYVYAFLSSKYGYAQLNKNASGSVVRYIEAPGIKKLIIPILDSSLVESVNKDINESVKLKETATELLTSAIQILSEYINTDYKKVQFKTGRISSKQILNSLQYRLDPPAIINDGVLTMKTVLENYKTRTISSLDDVKVYRPGIFKRNYVKEGIPYIKGSEIFLSDPFKRCDQVSKTRTPFIEEMSLKEGQILVTCAGSVGDIKLITKEYQDFHSIGSQDIIRIESSDTVFSKEYLFVYLQLPFVYDYIQSMKYGSVIERVEPFHIESIPVVVPPSEVVGKINATIEKYMKAMYDSYILENKAIQRIEHEIERNNR